MAYASDEQIWQGLTLIQLLHAERQPGYDPKQYAQKAIAEQKQQRGAKDDQ